MRRGIVDTTSGPLVRKSIQLAWPAVIQAVLVNFYAFNDFLFVGMLSNPDATAALSSCFAILIVVAMLVRIVPTGASTLIAQFTGAKDDDAVQSTFRTGLVGSVCWAMAVGAVALVFMQQIVELNNATAAVNTHIRDYLTVLMWTAPAFGLLTMVDGTFRSRGDTRTPLVLEIGTLGLNTFLNYVLVLGNFGFESMGVTGAALATGLSRMVPALIGLALISRGSLGFAIFGTLQDWAPDSRRLYRMSRIGLYESLSGVLYGVVYLMLNRMAGEIGSAAQGGLGAGLRGIEWIAFAFADGFLIASITIVGQNVGAGQHRRAWKGAWTTALLSLASCQLIGLAFLLFPGPLCELVTDDAQTLAYAIEYVYIIGWVMWAVGFEMATYGALIGTGRTEFTLLISGFANIIRVPIAAYLLFGSDAVVEGTLWAAFGVGDAPALTGVFAALAYTIAGTAILKAIVYAALLASPRLMQKSDE